MMVLGRGRFLMSEVPLYSQVGMLGLRSAFANFGTRPGLRDSGGTTPCRMTGVTLHGVVSPERSVHPDRLGMSKLYVQGYLAHKKQHPPQDPTVGLCLGPYGGPRGGLFLMSEVPLY